MRRTASLGIIFAILAGAPSLAGAQEGARELFEAGHAAYRVGDYEKARDLWERAYALDPRPHLQFNIGQAHERLGDLERAIAATERYVRETSPNDPNRGDAIGRVATMKEKLARTAIVIRTDVEGAVVEIDGEERARTPRRDPIGVAPGVHTVVVRHPELPEYEDRVRVLAGEVVELKVSLAEAPPPAREDAPRERSPALPGFVLAGAGGAAALSGVALGAAALRGAKDAPSHTGSAADRARALSTGADVLLVGGLVVAAGGVLWAVLAKRNAERASEEAGAEAVGVRVVPVASASALGLNLSGEF